jgi:hypothetical protein
MKQKQAANLKVQLPEAPKINFLPVSSLDINSQKESL